MTDEYPNYQIIYKTMNDFLLENSFYNVAELFYTVQARLKLIQLYSYKYLTMYTLNVHLL